MHREARVQEGLCAQGSYTHKNSPTLTHQCAHIAGHFECTGGLSSRRACVHRALTHTNSHTMTHTCAHIAGRFNTQGGSCLVVRVCIGLLHTHTHSHSHTHVHIQIRMHCGAPMQNGRCVRAHPYIQLNTQTQTQIDTCVYIIGGFECIVLIKVQHIAFEMCHFFSLKSQSIIQFYMSLSPHSIKKKPGKFRLDMRLNDNPNAIGCT